MSVRKNRPVLYEVARRREAGSAPTGWKPRSTLLSRPPAEPPATAVETPPSTAKRSSAADIDDEHRAVGVAQGRMQFSLAWPTLAVIGAAGLVVLVLMFQFGKRFAAPAGTAPPPAASDAGNGSAANTGLDAILTPKRRATPPTEPAGKPGPEGSREGQSPPREPQPPAKTEIDRNEPPPPDAPTVTLEKGMSYIHIQFFRKKDLDDAEAAARYLQGKGVRCAIMPRESDNLLIATEAFHIDQKDSAARKSEQKRANDLIAKIKQLGKEYARSAGYAFDQAEVREIK